MNEIKKIAYPHRTGKKGNRQVIHKKVPALNLVKWQGDVDGASLGPLPDREREYLGKEPILQPFQTQYELPAPPEIKLF